ncbi:glycosyl hydrolase 115 family protein [Rheinheimera aquimaris]|uniref:Glycosyl hydrolase 115 family protein n=1 Tax=Rheinheimera aquimaris TaxID=412437 RepID=A0ABP3PE19_9GAMM|nr:glycosyl hydrolase 115 family protein [Rheinheimera aquimaris]MCB5215036.1 glycosyl hydrolase 115 family protein [Rheinheimera aquimaris]
MRQLLLLATLLLSHAVQALPGNYLAQQRADGDFALVATGSQALILVDQHEHKGVLRAVDSLQRDINSISGRQLAIATQGRAKQLLIIGSLGNNALLDQLVSSGKLDVSAIAGKWDAYHIQLIAQPLPGVDQALVIAGSDKRGAIYGIYDLAETLGVSPWHWWADVTPVQRAELYIKAGTAFSDAPKVKYRGIFLNDEHPALTNWSEEKFGGYNSRFYLHVFELLQRLKANFLWPAMWNNAFADDDWQNAVLADEMGIVMSTSHHEPMMRADKEWNRYGEGPWEYSTNRDNIYKFWQQGAKRHKNLESLFTLGMRGQEDEPMSEGDNIELLQQIVADQRQILQETFNDRPIASVPQVWALYKEVQGFYERGMRVPDDVTLLWADDNFGNIRRLPTKAERNRSGGAGVYYHFDYVGAPRSYRWINTVPLAKIWQQMSLAWQYQADRIWIVNVGDLKPMELPTDFFLRMAWNPDAFNADNLQQFTTDWAAQQFGAAQAPAIASLLQTYTAHNGRRKPEAIEPGSYSILHYAEAERISTELAQAEALADKVQQQLTAQLQDAYVQLVAHPLKASRAVFELNRAVAMNQLHAQQGRASTNYWAERVKYWFDTDANLTAQYHSLGNGRWNHMMSQPHIGFTYWRNPPANLMPVVSVASPMPVADMGVAAEGSKLSWPISEYRGEQLKLDTFHPHGQQQRQIEVFNKGSAAFEFSAKASADWVTLSQSQGAVKTEQRIAVSIDWRKAQTGLNQAEVYIKGTGWGGAKVQVSAFKPAVAATTGFVEADGYIALDAASAKVGGSSAHARWQKLEGFGHSAAAMVALTERDYQPDEANIRQAPYLEYPLYFHSTGQVMLHSTVAPTLQLLPGRKLRFAVALDDAQPVIVDTLPDSSEHAWQHAVLDSSRTLKTPLHIKQSGVHRLRIYLLDPAVVLHRLLLDSGGVKPSYLGPPQSLYLTDGTAAINGAQ